MLKKYSTLMLIGLIINLAFSSFVLAQDAETKAAEKNKVRVAKLGIGGRLIEVKLKDDTKIKGYITEIKEDSFVLVGKKNAVSTNISYNQVKKIQKIVPTTLVVAGIVAIGLVAVFVVVCGTGRCED